MSNSLRTVESFFDLTQILPSAALLRAADSLGIPELLGSGQKTAEQIGEALSLEARHLEPLLALLCQVGLLERFGDDFALSQASRMIPVDFLETTERLWQPLEPLLKGTHVPGAEAERDFHRQRIQLEWTQTPAGLDMLKALGIGTERQGLSVLDLYCGPAILGMAIAHHDPTAFVTCVDHKAELERARKTSETVDALQRCDFVDVADFHNGQLTGRFDLVLLADHVHMISSENCRSLLQQIRGVLRTPGELAIVAVFPGQERGAMAMHLFELSISLGLSNARLQSLDDLRQWLEEMGFEAIQYAQLPSPPCTRGLLLALAR